MCCKHKLQEHCNLYCFGHQKKQKEASQKRNRAEDQLWLALSKGRFGYSVQREALHLAGAAVPRQEGRAAWMPGVSRPTKNGGISMD